MIEKLKQLVAKGLTQGYINSFEFKKCLSADVIAKEQADEIEAMISEMGIELRSHRAEIIDIRSARKK